MENGKSILGGRESLMHSSTRHIDHLKPYNYAEKAAHTEQQQLRRKITDIRSKPGQYSKQKMQHSYVSLPRLEMPFSGAAIESLRIRDEYYYVRMDGEQQKITVDGLGGARLAQVPLTPKVTQEYLSNKKKWLKRQLMNSAAEHK